MAEAIFRKLTEEEADPKWQVSSAGIYAATGSPATHEALEVVKGFGLDISGHSARQLTMEVLKDVDIILTMTVSHKQSIQNQFPLVADGVFTVKEYAGRTDGLDITDPYGQGLEAYHAAAAELRENLALVWERLERETRGSGGP